MNQFTFLLSLGLVALMGTSAEAVAFECEKCSTTNLAACINDTAFDFCFDGITKTGLIGFCADGEVCTNGATLCEPKTDTIELSCPNGGSCSGCSDATASFACVSKNQFVACKNGIVTTDPISCTEKKVCNIAKLASTEKTLCVSTCDNEPTCSNDAPVKADPTDPINFGKSCDTVSADGLYLNVADATCKTYVYCEKVDTTTWQSILYKCSTGYFDKITKKCVQTKPTGCKDS